MSVTKPDIKVPENFWANVWNTKFNIDSAMVEECLTVSQIMHRYQLAQCIRDAIEYVEDNNSRKFIPFYAAFIVECWSLIKEHNSTVAQTGQGLLVDFDDKSIYYGDELEFFKEVGIPDIDKYIQWLQ